MKTNKQPIAEEVKKEIDPTPAEPKMDPRATPPIRKIVIETDGDKINLVQAEVGGRIELVGILQNLITFLNTPAKQ
jgi:hypothetical protein